MGGKRREQPSGNAQGKHPSAKRQTRASAQRVPQEARTILSPVTWTFSMRCDASALAGRKDALEAALMKLVADFGGSEFMLERTLVGPSDDTLQRVLPLILERRPKAAWRCFRACRAWRGELEARGFCRRTWQLCSTLASGNIMEPAKRERAADTSDESSSEDQTPEFMRDHFQRLRLAAMRRICERLAHKVLRRLEASTSPAERSLFLDAAAFLQRSWLWEGTLHEWLQAASQEPDASFLSRGAVSTMEILGLPLVQWPGKPQGRHPGLLSLRGHGAFIPGIPFTTISGEVRSVAFSPDGKMVVSGGEDKVVKIWNADTGAMVWTSPRHETRRPCVCTQGCSGVVGNPECTLGGHTCTVSAVAFSRDGKYFVSGSLDGFVKIWDATTRTEVRKLNGDAGAVFSVAFSLDGTRIVSAHEDRLVKIWNTETGAEIHSIGHSCTGICICAERAENGDWEVNDDCPVSGHDFWANSVAISADGKRVVSGSHDGTVKIWDVETGAEERTLKGHEEPVNCVDFSPDGKLVVSGGNDMTVKIWDTATGAKVRTWSGHTAEISSVTFSLDGKRVVSGSHDKLVRIWDVATGALERTLTGHSKNVHAVAISPDGKRVVSGSADNLVKIWNAETDPAEWTLTWDSHVSVVFSPDGKRVVSESIYDNFLRLWNAETGAQALTLGHACSANCTCSLNQNGRVQVNRDCKVGGHTGAVTSFAFSPDGKRVVSASRDNTVKIWDVETGAEVVSIGHSGEGVCICTALVLQQRGVNKGCPAAGHSGTVRSIAISADGKRVVSGSDDQLVKMWNAETGAEVWTSRTHDCKDGCICTMEDRSEMAAMFPGTGGCLLLEVNLACPVAAHTAGVKLVAFSRDGTRVVSWAGDNTVKIWNAETGAEVCTVRKLYEVKSICFSPDGKWVVCGSRDREIKIRNAATGAMVCTLRGHTKSVTRVEFSDNGKQIISASFDDTVRFWDVASRSEFHQLAGSDFCLVEGASIGAPRTKQHVLTWHGENHCQREEVVASPEGKLQITELEEEEDEEVLPYAGEVAFFIPSAPIFSVGCHGTNICVGCSRGAVSFLRAPFLAP